MRITDNLVETLLHEHGVSAEAVKSARDKATANTPLQEIAIKSKLIKEPELIKLYAKHIDVPYEPLDQAKLPKDALNKLPERLARQYRCVVFGTDNNGTTLIAMQDPDDIQALNYLRQTFSDNIRPYITTTTALNAALDQYRGSSNVGSELTKVINLGSEEADKAAIDEDVDSADLAEDSPIAQTVNLIIEYAIKAGASDIHIEPREDIVITRYRVDGLLREANQLPRKVLGALVSRIKILSNLKIDEHRAPQDGRFKIQVGPLVYALRVSTLPIVDGEKVVMRILNESSQAADFSQLGFWGYSKETLEQAVKQPHGMVLVTGPTGSGKSTTLFSVLSGLNQPHVNISTVEDPVEYRIPGVNQIQVNPVAGMTFTSGLRALLRQDPNIIMVGEIRDRETAELGVQAALTGHLVFSTLHTNNAATCLPRLLEMGIEPFLIASTVRVVVGQRLVRKLCAKCREQYLPTASALEQMSRTFDLTHALKLAEVKHIEHVWRAKEGGCDACNHTGYKGRIGIYEVFKNSPEIQKLIIGNESSDALQKQAIKEGMVTMQQDGLVKALHGETTIEEILRVTTVE